MAELSRDSWITFYTPFFASDAECVAFVDRCKRQEGPTLNSRIIMHQVRRLITLSDDSLALRPGRHSLVVFWLLVCAEAVASLYANVSSDRKSRMFVQAFFRDFLSAAQQAELGNALKSAHDLQPLGLKRAVDALYKVRCSVAHEGNYWDWQFVHQGTPMLNLDPDVIAELEVARFRELVVLGGITAAKALWRDAD